MPEGRSRRILLRSAEARTTLGKRKRNEFSRQSRLYSVPSLPEDVAQRKGFHGDQPSRSWRSTERIGESAFLETSCPLSTETGQRSSLEYGTIIALGNDVAGSARSL
jgi:hypothetical protein